MAAVTFSLGKNAKLYVGVGGATTPSTEVKRVTNVTLTRTRDEIDISNRESSDVKVYLAGQADWELTFDILCDQAASGPYVTIRDAYLAGTSLNFKALDRASGNGIEGSFIITECSEDQPMDGVIKASVKAKPTIVDDTYLPKKVTAS